MSHGDTDGVVAGAERASVDRDDREYRLVPPSITPLGVADFLAGLRDHVRGVGRESFRETIATALGAETTATYTSYRRGLAACFAELAESATDRDEVLVPAFCSSDFGDAIEGVGLERTRYDIDAETLALDLDSVRKVAGEQTLALAVVNVLGYSSPMEAVREFCDEQGIYLVETLGYALGSSYRGRPLGTFGDVAVLNFQQGKPIPVGGGMVAAQTADLAFSDRERPAVSPNVAALAGYKLFAHPRLYYVYSRLSTVVDEHVQLADRVTTHPGSKLDVEYSRPFATISDFQGAVADRVFDRLEDHRRQRARTARFYATELADCPRIRHLRPVEGLSNHQYVRYPLVVDSQRLRERIRAALRDVGVQSTILYDWPKLDPAAFPEAARLQRGILTIPTHPYSDHTDRRRIVETIERVVTDRTDGSNTEA